MFVRGGRGSGLLPIELFGVGLDGFCFVEEVWVWGVVEVVGFASLGGVAALVLVAALLSGSRGCQFGGGIVLVFVVIWRTAGL